MIANFFTRLGIAAADLFYPPLCCLCNEQLTGEETYICSKCLNSLPIIEGARCPKCSRPIRTKNAENQLCGVCRTSPNKFLMRTVAAGEYHGALKSLIHLYKYKRRQFLSVIFADIIIKQLKFLNLDKKFDLLLPIPLHWTRIRWRGFNQAAEICRHIKNILNIPVADDNAFKRIKKTTPQALLNAKSRAENIRGAFRANNKFSFAEKNIALVDDVYTTGATSGECARVLMKAGAKSVSLLIIAR